MNTLNFSTFPCFQGHFMQYKSKSFNVLLKIYTGKEYIHTAGHYILHSSAENCVSRKKTHYATY